MPQICAPKFIAVWPCSHSLFLLTRAAQRSEELDWYIPEWLNLICQWVVEWIHQRSRAGHQERHVLSFKKKNYHHIHKQCYLSTFCFTFWLPSSVACWFAWLLHKHHVLLFKKKILIIAFTSIVLFQSPFFRTSFVFADSDGWFTSITFSFKKLFSSHSRALLLSFTFCFSDTFGFLVNGSWSHDKLSAPYFVPCCTENISMIEMDHSLHCYHWMHFTKRLWEKVPATTRQILLLIHKTRPVFSEGTETVSSYLIRARCHEKVSHKVDEKECRWAKCAPSEGNSVGASGAPLRALSSDFVVLSSASERPETELFQWSCSASLGVCVTEVSSVKTKRGELSVEITDQPFVTKWTICLQTRYSLLPVRRPPWLRKHSFSTAQVHVMIGSPSSALSIPEEEEEELSSAMSIAFAWL